MHQQAKLPEIFDQIPQNIRVFWDLVPEHPLPPNEIPRVQIWPYPEHHPPPPENWKL